MNKEFVPYEQALELKDLGFDEECYLTSYFNAESEEFIPTPLWQQVFRWFRDKKLSDSYVYRYQDRTDGSINFGYSIIHNYGIEEIRFIKENYTSYEEAELACLNKLIEIIKQK